jgi:hypothetical protein
VPCCGDTLWRIEWKEERLTVYLKLDSVEDDVLTLVRSWILQLSLGNYQSALNLTYVSEDSEWTAERLQQMIENYGFESLAPGAERMHVTDLAEAEAKKGKSWFIAAVYRARQETLDGAAVEYGLPLNGSESDLNAHFEVVRTPDGLALELFDIRVD